MEKRRSKNRLDYMRIRSTRVITFTSIISSGATFSRIGLISFSMDNSQKNCGIFLKELTLSHQPGPNFQRMDRPIDISCMQAITLH